ncbi:MAG: toxin-antitoxin system TumE family protein [bacterium]
MIETYFNKIFETLSLSFAISSFNVSKLRIAEDDGFIRVRCSLINGDTLEFAEYVKISGGEIKIESYSYHWQSSDGTLVKRWDNVPHHPEFSSFPYHLHQPEGSVVSSPLMNFSQVLLEIENTVKTGE